MLLLNIQIIAAERHSICTHVAVNISMMFQITLVLVPNISNKVLCKPSNIQNELTNYDINDLVVLKIYDRMPELRI